MSFHWPERWGQPQSRLSSWSCARTAEPGLRGEGAQDMQSMQTGALLLLGMSARPWPPTQAGVPGASLQGRLQEEGEDGGGQGLRWAIIYGSMIATPQSLRTRGESVKINKA